MPLKSCHRLTNDTGELCRYEDRLTDCECHRCVLAVRNRPIRRSGTWFDYRKENDRIKAETRINSTKVQKP